MNKTPTAHNTKPHKSNFLVLIRIYKSKTEKLKSNYRVCKPTYTLAILPDSFFHHARSSCKCGFAMLPSSSPPSRVFSTIWPMECSFSVLLIVFIFTVILSSIGPRVNTLSVHQIVFPVSFIFSSICPLVSAKAFHSIVNPFSAIFIIIRPCVRTDALSLSLIIVSNIA